MTSAASSHPVRLEVDYPASLSRWKIFFKGLFIIPNAIVLSFVQIGFMITTVLSWFAILFTGRYPRGMFNFAESYMRWSTSVSVYTLLLRDEYPAFSGTAGKYAPLRFSVEYPERLSRIMIFLKGFALIPSFIAFVFVLIGALVVEFIAWWVILFTGKMPEGMFNYLVGTLRWGVRISAYQYFMTDKYPPFRMGA